MKVQNTGQVRDRAVAGKQSLLSMYRALGSGPSTTNTSKQHQQWMHADTHMKHRRIKLLEMIILDVALQAYNPGTQEEGAGASLF